MVSGSSALDLAFGAGRGGGVDDLAALLTRSRNNDVMRTGMGQLPMRRARLSPVQR